jgi:hypothetical protein
MLNDPTTRTGEPEIDALAERFLADLAERPLDNGL